MLGERDLLARVLAGGNVGEVMNDQALLINRSLTRRLSQA